MVTILALVYTLAAHAVVTVPNFSPNIMAMQNAARNSREDDARRTECRALMNTLPEPNCERFGEQTLRMYYADGGWGGYSCSYIDRNSSSDRMQKAAAQSLENQVCLSYLQTKFPELNQQLLQEQEARRTKALYFLGIVVALGVCLFLVVLLLQ